MNIAIKIFITNVIYAEGITMSAKGDARLNEF